MDKADEAGQARFRGLFEAHYGAVLSYARRRCAEPQDADDVVAETFTVAWRRGGDIPAGGELPWLYGVARKVLANQRRGQRRWLGLIERVSRQRVDVETPAIPASAVTEALRRLRPDDQEVLRLSAWEGLSQAEIGQALGITANAAGIRVHRARRRLAEQLGEAAQTGRNAKAAAGQSSR